MALFKISKGLSSKMPGLDKSQDGWCWFTTDDQMFHIDYLDNGVLKRAPLNANDTKTLTGASLKQELNDKADEIPSSAVVSTQIGRLETLIGQNSEEIDTKMDKENPAGSGTFNFNTSYATGTNAVAFGGRAEGYNSFAFGEQTQATGNYSFVCGYNTRAKGAHSHCEGGSSEASGDDSHAEGFKTLASAQGAHSEGRSTTASGHGSHSEGGNTIASGLNSHAEGDTTTASGWNSHTSGFGTAARTKSQFVIGEFNLLDSKTDQSSRGDYVFIIGKGTADDARSNAMTVDWSGNVNIANQLIHGKNHTITAAAEGIYAGGSGNTVSGSFAHAEGQGTTASDTTAHAEGTSTTASGNASHAEGSGSSATGDFSHAEGSSTVAEGNYSHAEGNDTDALGQGSHAEGWDTTASGSGSHAEGYDTTSSGDTSHAEGHSTTASGPSSHAEGQATTASGFHSHAENTLTTASGSSSHAGGDNTIAAGTRSFTHGYNLTANGESQAVFGQYNTPNETDIFQIGGGTSTTATKNIFSVDYDGDAKIAKSLNIGGLEDTSGTAHTLYVSGPSYFLAGIDTDPNYSPSKDTELVPKKYVQDNLPTLSHKYMIAEEGQTAFDFADQGVTSLREYCLVYYDGLLLIEGIHYNISTSGTAIILLDWMANAGHTVQVVSSAPINPDGSLFNQQALINALY